METIKMIELKKIEVSKFNARKHYDVKAMKDLEKSIKEKGVIEPIIVRPKEKDKYEIVCGERRYRASENLGKKEMLAIVRELTDDQALEFQVIENLHREDVPAIDEAEGFQLMLEKCKYGIDDLAAKTGKCAKHIRDRIKLLSLPPEIRKAIESGMISAGHGIVISRLKDIGEQKSLLETIITNKLSIRSAENQLSNAGEYMDDANFDKTKCKTCVNNGALIKDLFDPDTNLRARCMNPQCYKQKQAEHIKMIIEKYKKKNITLLTKEDASKSKTIVDTFPYDEGLEEYAKYNKEFKKIFKKQCLKGCKNYVGIIDINGKIVMRCNNRNCFKLHTIDKKELDRNKKVKEDKEISEQKKQHYVTEISANMNPMIIEVLILCEILPYYHEEVRDILEIKGKEAENQDYCLSIKPIIKLDDQKRKDLINKILMNNLTEKEEEDLKALYEAIIKDPKKEDKIA